jgi:hypothetical protein
MIICNSRTEFETKRTNFGSLLVSVSLLLIILSAYYVSAGFFVIGIISISIKNKTKIDFNNKVAIKYYNVLGIPFQLFRKRFELNKFSSVYLYQKSEKGAIQTRIQTLASKNGEY